jgi:uncharacterized NAD(P)/FAD-binding protein YdhS
VTITVHRVYRVIRLSDACLLGVFCFRSATAAEIVESTLTAVVNCELTRHRVSLKYFIRSCVRCVRSNRVCIVVVSVLM